MITPDAKNIVNGKKVNAVIRLLNELIGKPSADVFDVVEAGNQPGSRFLFVGNLNNLKQSGEDYGSQRGNLGGPGDNAGVQRDQPNPGDMPAGGDAAQPQGVNAPQGVNPAGIIDDEKERGAGSASGSQRGDREIAVQAGDQTEAPSPSSDQLAALPPQLDAGDFTSVPRSLSAAGGDELIEGRAAAGDDLDKTIPSTANGEIDLQALGAMVESGNASDYQIEVYNEAMEKYIPVTASGQIDLRALGSLVESGKASDYQRDYYNKAMEKSIPVTSSGQIDLRALGAMVESGKASNYQREYYENAMEKSLPVTSSGHVNLMALGSLVESGKASDYQRDYYNKAMGKSLPVTSSGDAASNSTINDRFIQSEYDLYGKNVKRIQQMVAQQGGDINVYLESFNRVFEAGYEERRRKFFNQAFKK